VFLYSCDKNNSIGDGLIGDNHFDFVKYTSSVGVLYQKVRPIQSNNLSVNSFGYDNSFLGQPANFATQIVLVC
jgi:hypothetical protein